MKSIPASYLKRGLMLAFLFVVLFGLVTPVQAQQIVYGSTVPAGTTVDNDAILVGNAITIDGNVNGNVIAIGNTVTVNGDIQGNLLTLAQMVTVNGTVSDGVYSASLAMDFGPESSIGRNVAYAGISLDMKTGSKVGRDVYGMMLGARLTGSVERQVQAIIGPVEIVKMVLDAFNLKTNLPWLNSSSYLPGQKISFLASAGKNVTGVGAAAINPPAAASIENILYLAKNSFQASQPPAIDSVQAGNWFKGVARQFLFLLIIGLLSLWLAPRWLKLSADNVRKAPFKSTGYGLVVAIVGNIAVVLLAMVVIALMVGLFWAGLYGLGVLFGGAGFSMLGVAYFFFLLVLIPGSKVIVAFMLGSLILKRMADMPKWYRILSLLLGLLLYVLAQSIPYLGWAIAVIVAFLGTGAAWSALLEIRRTPQAIPPAIEPADSTTEAAAVAAPAADEEEPVAPVSEPEASVEVPAETKDGDNQEQPASDTP